jgi:hypothetical protein
MKTIEQIRIQPRLCITQEGPDGGAAWAELKATIKPDRAHIIFSWGGGWDHVSVSFRRRTPTWDEMCEIKDMFFRADETVVQFHPEEDEYINQHPYCLHLWKKQGHRHELPPWWMIGLKKGMTTADIPASAYADSPVLRPGA